MLYDPRAISCPSHHLSRWQSARRTKLGSTRLAAGISVASLPMRGLPPVLALATVPTAISGNKPNSPKSQDRPETTPNRDRIAVHRLWNRNRLDYVPGAACLRSGVHRVCIVVGLGCDFPQARHAAFTREPVPSIAMAMPASNRRIALVLCPQKYFTGL